MIYPITFSIPKEKIVNNIPVKTKLLAHIIPGKSYTYIFDNESNYYKDYQISYFAITKKKGGWDCLRHYEIMANGCIPVFLDIINCPPNTLKFIPKKLLIVGLLLYDKLKHKSFNTLTNDDKIKCNKLITKLLNYTRKYLTTEYIANYILNVTTLNNKKRILYLSGKIAPDYMRCLTLHGFKSLLGADCHDFPKIPHIYKQVNNNYSSLYGKGITYSNLIDIDLHNNLLNKKLLQDIKHRYYDIIIYGSYHRGMPLYNYIIKYYKANEIVLLCGEDIHICNHKYMNNNHHIFVREL